VGKSATLAFSLILLTVACSSSGYEVFYGQNAYFDPGRGYHIDGHSRQTKVVYANEWFKGE
jgi:hypothetical protein